MPGEHYKKLKALRMMTKVQLIRLLKNSHKSMICPVCSKRLKKWGGSHIEQYTKDQLINAIVSHDYI